MRTGLLAAGLAAVHGCTRTAASPDPAPASADTLDPAAGARIDAPVVLEIVNTSNYDVRIYAIVEGGGTRRLGLVTMGKTEQFVLPPALVNRQARFRAEPISYRQTQTTASVLLRPGLLVRMGLEKQLRSHTFSYYYD